MLLVIMLVLLLGLVIYFTYREYDFLPIIIGFILFFAAVAVILIAIAIPAEKIYIETTYDVTVAQYRVTYTETLTIITSDNIQVDNAIVQGSIEKIGAGVEAAQRVKELRDVVNQYNLKLAGYKFWSNNIFVNIFYPELNSNVKPLTVK